MSAALFSKWIHRFLILVYLGFFLSLFCGFRVMSSSCVGSLLGLTILLAVFDKNHFIRKPFFIYFVWGCLAFYLLQLIGLLYTNDTHMGGRQAQVKISLFFIPVALYFSNYLDPEFRQKLMPYYVLMIGLVMSAFLAVACVKYQVSHDSAVFFYHELVKPLGQHAVYFSIYTFVGLVYLLGRIRRHSYMWNKPVHFFIVAFLLLCIVLLASKLVIIFSFLSVLIYLSLYMKNAASSRGLVVVISVISIILLVSLMVTQNPVSRRFRDLFNGNIDVVENTAYNQGQYFNGLQFRLLQWKIVREILSEHKAWLFGVSPGDAQHLIDSKYISFNMYQGDGKGQGRGYLNYNTHNQFLQATLQSGIAGLLVFLIICGGCIQMMMYNRNTEFFLVGTLLLLYCFVESILQTQFGSLMFTFFPLFLFYTTMPESAAGTVASGS